MCLFVFGQVGAVSKPFTALLTEVGLLASVTAEMFSQGPGLGE